MALSHKHALTLHLHTGLSYSPFQVSLSRLCCIIIVPPYYILSQWWYWSFSVEKKTRVCVCFPKATCVPESEGTAESSSFPCCFSPAVTADASSVFFPLINRSIECAPHGEFYTVNGDSSTSLELVLLLSLLDATASYFVRVSFQWL